MTDRELIQLLQEKSAGELTPVEVEKIRARWTQSPELRQALVEHLHLESQLAGVLSPINLDVDAILQQASRQRQKQRLSRPLWLGIVGLGLLMTIGLFALFGFARKPNEVPLIVESQPSNKTKQAATPSTNSEPIVQNEETASPPEVVDVPNIKPVEVAEPLVSAQPDPMRKVEVNEIAANEPWSGSLARDIAPWAVNSPKLVADYKSAGHDEFPDSEAKRWLSQVEGQPYNWSTDSVGNPVRRIARFQGLAKLRAPWPDNAVLRVTPFEVNDLTFYFWRGPVGVAFRFYTRRDPHQWAAFEIARENSSPKPTRFGLLTTDSGAYERSTPGTFDIRQQDGELVLARGGLVLLSVPFQGAPIEVFMEGQLRLRGLSMHRSAPFQNRPQDSHRILFSGPAANLPWAISAESPASLTTHDDGSVTATIDSRDKPGLIGFPFGWLLAMRQSTSATGLFEAIVKVESADPGTGIFLGDRDARPLQQLGFFRDNATHRVTFGILRPGEHRLDSNVNPNDFPPPLLATPGWFKLVAGLGTLHVQVSGDGIHWGHLVECPGRDLPGAVGSIGLFGLQGSDAKKICISQVSIRELNGITDLADQSLRSLIRPFSIEHLRDAAAWNHRVLETRPLDADPSAWITANAVAALAQGPPKEFGSALLKQLVAVGMRSTLSFEKKRQLLNDACLLCDLFDDAAAKSLGQWYEDLGSQLAESGDANPLAKVRPLWLWSPIWTTSKMRYVWERLHSHAILHAVYRRDWPVVWALSQSAMYWNLVPNPDQRPTERGEDLDRHARWGKALVGEVASSLDDGSAGVMPTGWRHPLMPVLNKEAYNVRAELQSALRGQNFEDSCRIVMSIAETDGTGLLPDVDDRQLYVSLPTAVANARKEYPRFSQTMTDKFEPLGKIRVKAALNRRDIAGLQAATLQFIGTDAARDAHSSLGDLALSVGRFDVAEQHFLDALTDAGNRQRESLEPRLLLARALGGRLSPGQPAATSLQLPNHSIELNGSTISPADFQAIITDLAVRPASANLVSETIAAAHISIAESSYKLETRGRFDGQPGNNPGRWEYRFGDPFGRQMSAASDAQRIYVSNRFQVNAYLLPDGQQAWSQGLGSEQGETYGLPFTPMKPLLAGDRIFVRRLTKAGAELACLKSDDGQVIWHQRPSHSVLSDPVIWDGRLFALVLARVDEEIMQVEADWFDPSTGNVSSSRPLFRLRDASERQFSGMLTLSDRRAVCTVAGTTACFDSRGEVCWLRRHTMLQRPADELAEDFRMAAPAIWGNRVTVTMPGVREVCCLDLESGHSLWERPITNLRGLIDVTDSRVFVETVTGIESLDTETGEIAWHRSIDTRLEASTIEGSKLLLTRRVTSPNNRSKAVATWFDVQTGRELATTLLDLPDREEFQLGPMFSAGGKWWTFVGQGWKESKRDLYEFVAIPAIVPQSFEADLFQAWRPDMLDAQRAEIASVVPGWFPVANYRDRLSLHPGEIRGEVFPLVSRIDSQHSVRFSSRVRFAAGRNHALHLRVGNQPGQAWNLQVLAENHVLFEQTIEDSTGINGWRDLSIDVSRLAGHDTIVEIIQTTANNAAADALLKRAELTVE